MSITFKDDFIDRIKAEGRPRVLRQYCCGCWLHVT